MVMKNVKVIKNPVICQSLCTMRNKNTDSQGVRIAARKITRVLLYEESKNLPLVDKEIETPLTKFVSKDIANDIKIIISPILRAGLIFTDEAIDIFPDGNAYDSHSSKFLLIDITIMIPSFVSLFNIFIKLPSDK